MLKSVPVEVSARHIHLSEGDLRTLCGPHAVLNWVKELSQPGQFLSDLRLEIIGPKKTISNVSVLGPTRNQTQVEVSLTDARQLGVVAPIRESGDLLNSAPITLKGPVGEIVLQDGLIVAKRHIHMTNDDAMNYELENGQVVKVMIPSKERKLIFDDVVVRVRNDFRLTLHIDTDEGNAAQVEPGTIGEIYC